MPSRITHYTTLAFPILALVLAACSGERSSSTQAAIRCPSQTTHAAHQDICILDTCGNGVVDATEACDDGNRIDGDGCSSDCGSTETCGNGILDVTVGELCDDGNTVNDGTCCADCRSCPELAADFALVANASAPAEAERDAPAEPACNPAELACNPAELARALAELDAASTRADHAMEQASRALAQTRAASRRANRAGVAPASDDAQELIRELEAQTVSMSMDIPPLDTLIIDMDWIISYHGYHTHDNAGRGRRPQKDCMPCPADRKIEPGIMAILEHSTTRARHDR